MKFKKNNSLAFWPRKATERSAGYDLVSPVTCIIWPFQRKVIDTNISVELDVGQCGLIFPRSGLAIKRGLTLANSVGLIDEDYQENLMIGIVNIGLWPRVVRQGDRIAQFVALDLSENWMKWGMDNAFIANLSAKRAGGLGSTGR